jgi:hypothetical protein
VKPDNWSTMSPETKADHVRVHLGPDRIGVLIRQAREITRSQCAVSDIPNMRAMLRDAIRVLSVRPANEISEKSNAEDMEMMIDYLGDATT